MRRVVYYIVFLCVFGFAIYQIKLRQGSGDKSVEVKAGKEPGEEIDFLKGDFSRRKSQILFPDSLTTEGITLLDNISSPPANLDLGEISGRVLAPDKSPIARAELMLIAYAGLEDKFIKAILSDIEGRYLFFDLLTGIYELRAFHPSYATKSISDIQLKENQIIKDLDIILSTGVKLNGKVVNERNVAIEKAEVFVKKKTTRINPAGGAPLTASYRCAEAFSISDGSFTLERVPGGEVEIIARKQGYSEATLPMSVSEDIETSPILIILKEAAEIGGRVVDPEGDTVIGAEVAAISFIGADGERVVIPQQNISKVSTDDKGEFLLRELLAEIKYDIKVVAAGFPEAIFPRIKSNTFGNRLVLSYGGRVSGKVTYLADGRAAADIRVKAEKSGGFNFSASVLTEAQGDYLIADLPVGSYGVSIDSPFYTAPPRDNINVEAGKEVEGVDFQIYRGLKINGEVVDSRTKIVIPDAGVYLEGEIKGDGRIKKETKTDKSGRFSFDNLPEGMYLLNAEATGYITKQEKREWKRVILKIGEAEPFVTIRLLRGGTIKGVVYNIGRQPVSNAFVQLFQPLGARGNIDTSKAQTFTDSIGSFKIEGIDISRAVELFIRASAPGYATGVSPPILLSPSEPEVATEIILGRGGTLYGTVLEDSAAGQPLAYAMITICNNIFLSDQYYLRPFTYTDGSGKFYFYNVTPGQILLTAELPGYIKTEQSIDLAEGEVKSLQIILTKGYKITGRVSDDQNNPVERAIVAATPQTDGQTIETITDFNGFFIFNNLSSSVYNLLASFGKDTPQGFQFYQRQRRNIKTNSSSINIIFPINAEISGKVLDADSDKPIEGFRVFGFGNAELDAQGNTFNFWIPEKQYFQTNGEFHCYSLPTGEYSLTFYADGYAPQILSKLNVRSPFKLDTGTIYLSKGGGIKALLLSEITKEAINAVLGELDKGTIKTAFSDADGLMEFKSLREGSYKLTLTHEHYIKKVIPNISVSAGETTDLGTMYLEPGATINGTVKNGENNPIPGIHISAKSVEKTHETQTDQFGYYFIDGVKQGRVEIKAETNIAGLNIVKSQILDVLADMVYEVNFIFDASYSIRGHFRANDFALAQPRLYIYAVSEQGEISESRKREIIPAADMSYIAENLLKGQYLLIAEAKPVDTGGAIITLPTARCYALINLLSREYIYDPTFSSGLISGQIINEETGSPAPNLELTLIRSPEVIISTPATLNRFKFTTTSDDEGEFRLSPLPGGNFQLYSGVELLETISLAENQHLTDLLIYLH